MNGFASEFKAFAMRGNVVDLAVGIVIGGAFGKIVSSLVDSIVMPLVGILLGGINFSSLTFNLGKAVVLYGAFLQAVVDFVIIAFVIFLVVKAMNKMKKETPPSPATTPEDIQLLREIRDALKSR